MPRGRNSTETASEESAVRIDKWLWAARFYKTRSLAVQAIEAGHVHVNEQRCKPGRLMHVGDCVLLNRNGEERTVHVRELNAQRGPASIAQRLYEESPESIEKRSAAAALRALTPAPETSGRPTKRDRRTLQRWKDNSH